MADACIKALEGRHGATIANHGAITCDVSLAKAFTGSMVLEKTAQVFIDCQALGGPVELPSEDVETFNDFFRNKYGQR